MKVKKGNKIYPVVTGDDVIITKGKQSLNTLDDALDNQQKEIDKLKSNVKYIYSYGGVGGTGSGGNNGGGGSSSSPSVIALLNNHQLQNGGNALVLGTPGKYPLQVNVRNSNGNTFYIKITVNGTTTSPIPLSTSLNMNTYTTTLNLQTNDEISVVFLDSDGGILDAITQSYIVNPHTFSVKFKYKSADGKSENEFSEENEYFIGSTDQLNPFIDISYKISIPNVTNVNIEYSIGDTDGTGIKQYGSVTDISNEHLKLYLGDLKRNEKDFLIEENTGNYTVNVKLVYSANGSDVTEERSFTFTIIPSYLYINVKNTQNLIFNSLSDVYSAIDNGTNGIPVKSITEGSYASFYCKVYQNKIKTDRAQYTIHCETYKLFDSSESDGYENGDTPVFSATQTVTEQIESSTPFSVPFDEPGIYQVVFYTLDSKPEYDANDNRPTIKYIYVKKSESSLDWYPERGDNGIEYQSYYFRANNGNDTYSDNFPKLSSGNQPLELKISDKFTTTISDPAWGTLLTGCDTTILSLGMQYSEINTDTAKILETFSSSNTSKSDITLYPDYIFASSGEIRIPYTSNYNKSVNEQYHLVQIVRTKIEGESNTFATYLYIDGIPEAVKTSTDINNLYIEKIVLNNVNVSYNLIELQYINKKKYSVDELIFQYYLKFKEKMLQKPISKSELTIYNQMKLHTLQFNGESVVMDDETLLYTISPDMPIPTMMISYQDATTDEAISEFETILFQGYANGDRSFGKRKIKLFWCDGLKENRETSFHTVEIPTITGKSGTELTADWYVELQGTSTMRNKIKNFTLGIATASNDFNESILVSPNYDENDTSSFLPESSWTIKADIADSAHANNTSIGKFVNRTCTTFSTGQDYSSNKTAQYIKNTLEGFPIMMYFQIHKKVYYLGVYNFNMGRGSYYNLGYHTAKDMETMISNITSSNSGDGFCFSKSTGEIVNDLVVGEIQDNFPEFDCHQFDPSLLFDDGTSNYTKMFGSNSKITYGADIAHAKTTLTNFVKSVAEAGTYCFGKIGKQFVSSEDKNTHKCVDRYSEINCVPSVNRQMKYNGNDISWYDFNGFTYNTNGVNDPDMLYRCIATQLSGDEGEANVPYLDYTSASEYYTICMAFGLIDSVLKNMNIKSWDGRKCFIAFYDMDCANGEDNSGAETVSYLAATDYWHSDKVGTLNPVTIDWDYWDDNVGKGFDCKSSYIFAIVKYAQSVLGDDYKLTNYPQDFWVKLRNGQLQSADYFVDNYFKSGIGSVPTYLAALNYKVKYLYKGTILDENGKQTETRFLANSAAFHGSRVEKVRIWLKRRLHFLDAMFNVQNVNISIGGGFYVPKANTDALVALRNNPDVVILSDAFTTTNNNTNLRASKGVVVNIYAPTNTPFVMVNGNTEVYLLSEGTGKPNPISVTFAQAAFTAKFYGSTEFTDISMVEPFLTTAYQIVSNKIENITYGGTGLPPQGHDFTITSTSVKKINFNIPDYSGKLIITNSGLYGKAIDTLNVSNSKIYGEWDQLDNLQTLNISSVDAPINDITIKNCKLLKGDNCSISGTSEKLTSLKKLDMSDISGNFNLSNTAIETITMSAIDGEESTFEINGDSSLKSLSLTGFNSIKISGCINLESLTINEGITNKCKEISIDIPASYSSYQNGEYEPVLKNFNSDTGSGVFDFTKYDELETLTVKGCYGVEVIKIPNHQVKVKTLQENVNLEFVDTVGDMSIISLTGDYTFYMCPRYGMRQSWSSGENSSLNGVSIYDTEKSAGKQFSKTILTKMCVDESCTSLAHTFDKGYSGTKSKYLQNYYENSWGQYVHNKEISSLDATWFINKVIAGEPLDDAYIGYIDDDSGIIHDIFISNANVDKWKTPNMTKYITSLAGCFKFQDGLIYTGLHGYESNVPNLSKFTSLVDISTMYYSTGVTFITSAILSLPESNNNNESDVLDWTEIIKSGEVNITFDAFKNISYRITDFTSLTLSVYYYDTNNSNNLTLCKTVDMVELLNTKNWNGVDDVKHVKIKKDGNYVNVIPFERLTRFVQFSLNSTQEVDYRNLFNVCPNVTSLSGFLNTDLSKAHIDEIMKNCTKLQTITDSFNHSGNIKTAPTIDLYDFFNWGENTGISNLFTSSNTSIGFSLNKTISNDNFNTILGLLHNYKKLTSLSNIFSYCTITNYNNSNEITLAGDMNGVKIINALFYKCKGIDSSGIDVPLNIRRSFFEHLKNVVSLANTFVDVHFSHMFTFDFFNKYNTYEDTNVYVLDNGTYKPAKLITHNYGNSLITEMYHCFYGAKFSGCESWFDMSTSDNQSVLPVTDKVIYNGSEYTTYYTLVSGKYVEHTIKEPVEVSDNRNNFTNYVSKISIAENSTVITNHDIASEISKFSTYKISDVIKGWSDSDINVNIYKTYCCLPPDILFGCSSDCNLTGAFGNLNVVGVIPEHFVTKCYNGTFTDMFVNVNILPNVFYHYDKENSGDEKYISMIHDIIIDNDSIMIHKSDDDVTEYNLVGSNDDDAVVLFRNSSGELRRRYPYENEYAKSQFVYVPQNYTINTKLNKAFTFRYNLPNQIDLVEGTLLSKGITWPSGGVKISDSQTGYDSSYGPEDRPELWPYYVQYFFLADNSLDWDNVVDFSYPFISDTDDVDYVNNIVRTFSSKSVDTINTWWQERTLVTRDIWDNKTNGLLNVFLNLCGERDIRTGLMTDKGCIVSGSIKKYNYPKLDSIVSGNLSTFVNGQIFDQSTDSGTLSSINTTGSKVVIFNGFGRNIILPSLQNMPASSTSDPKVVLQWSQDTSLFYTFMFNDTISEKNYKSRYFGYLYADLNKQNNKSYFKDITYKYKVIK